MRRVSPTLRALILVPLLAVGVDLTRATFASRFGVLGAICVWCVGSALCMGVLAALSIVRAVSAS